MIGDLLDKFINDSSLWDNTGQTKQYVIKMLSDCDIANIQTDSLKSATLLSIAKIDSLQALNRKPFTIYHLP
ncbi:hypothetical protein [Psychromonas ingrahamii]|uniref:hypothetical protein n=1 Tax=Psychromonas ingrahamii TaxID=357794 RepID=UPI0000D80BC3|nr:hypothetical protein [Psychromonas ingrahamii]